MHLTAFVAKCSGGATFLLSWLTKEEDGPLASWVAAAVAEGKWGRSDGDAVGGRLVDVMGGGGSLKLKGQHTLCMEPSTPPASFAQ